MYGDETDNWDGKKIVLTSEFVEFQGKSVKGLRVKPPADLAQKPAAHQTESPAEEVPMLVIRQNPPQPSKPRTQISS